MFRKYLALFDEAPVDGGNGNPPPAPAPAAPPVAATVLNGSISEREADLQAQIDVLKAERDGATGRNKKLETDIAHLQDKLNAIQNPPPAPAPAPKPVREPAWHETFIGGGED